MSSLTSYPAPQLLISSFSTSKRSACDRCRAQKLRCPAREELSQPCSRCSRQGRECVISYTQPLGQQTKQNTHTDSSSSVSSQLTQLTGSNARLSEDAPDRSHATGSAVSGSWDWTPSYEHVQNSLDGAMMEDMGSIFDSADRDESLSSCEALLPSGSMELQLGNPHSSRQSPSRESVSLDECTGWFQSKTECDQRLTALNHELSKQISACSGSLGLSNHGSRKRSIDSLSGMERDGNSHHFGDALQGMSELVTITQSYQSKPSTIVTLHLLTAYLQMVTLSKQLMTRLLQQFDSGSKAMPGAEEIRALPGLQLAGVVVHQGDLKAKVFVQAVLHYFEALEKKLGLPQHLCVSGTGEAQQGLLCDGQAQSLISGFLNSPSPTEAGLDDIVLVRDTISQVRRVLHK